jgi:protocatechuate 3,4-dioxygenase beta subunit
MAEAAGPRHHGHRSRTPVLGVALVIALFLGGAVLPALPAQAAGTGSLTGTVTDPAGAPVSGAPVQARTTFYDDLVAATVTDAAGHYTIGGLTATGYKVRFVSPRAGLASTWNKNKHTHAKADVISVGAGPAVVDAVLPPSSDAPIPVGASQTAVAAGGAATATIPGTTSGIGNQLPGAPGCTDPSRNIPTVAACAGVSVANVWASINGPYEIHANGDPFATRCWGDTKTADLTGGSCTNPPAGALPNPAPPGGDSSLNPQYRPDGYLYAIDVATPGPVSVEIYDAAFDARRVCFVGQNGGTKTGPYAVGQWDPTCDPANNNNRSYPFSNRIETGDNAPTNAATMLPGPTTEYQLYDRSGSATAIDAHAGNELSGCTTGTGRLVAAPGAAGTYVSGGPGIKSTPTPYKNTWTTLCTFNAPAPGIYPLRVRVDDIPGVCPFTDIATPSGCKGAGFNGYAIRASGVPTRVYGIDDFSLYSNFAALASTVPLANIETSHAGRTAVLDLFDPGDGGCLSGSYGCMFTLTIKAPDGAGGLRNVPCSWQRSATRGGPPNGVSASPSTCAITTRDSNGSLFNNQWIRVRVPIPDDYTCAVNDCWWKALYNFNANSLPGDPSDRTTWAVSMADDLSGVVTDGAGRPVPDLTVEARDTTWGQLVAAPRTDASGRYTAQLPTGSYRLEIPAANGYARRFWSSTGGLVPTPLTVTSGGQPVTADFVVGAPTAIAGTVRDARGQPVPNVYALVVVADQPSAPAGYAVTDAAGAYVVPDLAPGAYKLAVLDGTSPPRFQYTAYPDVALGTTIDTALVSIAAAPALTPTAGTTLGGIDVTLADP